MEFPYLPEGDLLLSAGDIMLSDFVKNIAQTVTRYKSARNKQYTEFAGYEDLAAIDVATSDIYDDAFKYDKPVYEIEYTGETDKESIQKELTDWLKESNIGHQLEECFLETLLQGEYFYSYVEDSEMVRLQDDLDGRRIFALYKNTRMPIYFLELENQRIKVVSNKRYFHMFLKGRRLRISVDRLTKYGITDKRIPEFLKVGKSLFYPTKKNLKALQLLEHCKFISLLTRMLTPPTVGVSVPSKTDPDDVIEIMKHYEEKLRTTFPLGDLNNLNISELISNSCSVKCLPLYTDNKGTLEKVEVTTKDIAEINERIEEENAKFFNTLGMPYNKAIGETGERRNERVLTSPRYARILETVQSSHSNAIKQLSQLQIAKTRRYHISSGDIKVHMKSIPSAEDLARQEQALIASEFVDRVTTSLGTITQNPDFETKLNGEALVNFFNEVLKPLSNENILTYVGKKEEEEDDTY